MKIIIKIVILSLLSTPFTDKVFAENNSALLQQKQIDQNLVEDWKNYKLLEKEILEKIDQVHKLHEEEFTKVTTTEQGIKTLINLMQHTNLETITNLQKYKPKTKEMQELIELKITLVNHATNNLINNMKKQEMPSEDMINDEMEHLRILIDRAKILENKIEKKVVKISE